MQKLWINIIPTTSGSFALAIEVKRNARKKLKQVKYNLPSDLMAHQEAICEAS